MSEAEAKKASEIQAPGRSADGAEVQYGEVLAELEQIQKSKANWRNSILIFVASLLLFLVAGSALWSWTIALLLVPILLFHELGHYVAMRIFHYRNLRMFFIPFLGAAVSGRHYN